MRESPTLHCTDTHLPLPSPEPTPLTRREFLQKFSVAIGGATLLNSCSPPAPNGVEQSPAVNRFRMTGTAQNLSELEGEPSLLGIPFTLHTTSPDGTPWEATVMLTNEEQYRLAVGKRIFVLLRIESPVKASPNPGNMAFLGKTNAKAKNGLLLEGAIGTVGILEEEAGIAVRELLERGSPGKSIHLSVPCTLKSEGLIGGVASMILGQDQTQETMCSVVFEEALPTH